MTTPTRTGHGSSTGEGQRKLRILVACEFSGVVRRAFRALGHEAWSCDLLPAEDGSPFHIQGDAISAVLRGCEISPGVFAPWDLVIAHPPCTFLANSGVRWLYDAKSKDRIPERWKNMRAGAKFFADLWNACGGVPRCFENPVMHCHAQTEIDRLAPGLPLGKRVQYIQPWQHGHPETKATGLYLFGLPPLKPSNVVFAQMSELTKAQRSRVHYASPGPDRWKERSRTLPGIAKAMAEQWSAFLAAAIPGNARQD